MAVTLLDRARTVAPTNWSRWQIPPGAVRTPGYRPSVRLERAQDAAGATSFSIMIALPVIGFVANELVRPVHSRYHEPAAGALVEKESA